MVRIELDERSVKQAAQEIHAQLSEKILEALIEIADEAIKMQWVQFRPESYDDQTGQLRSSTGYIIYHNGQVMHEHFSLSTYGTDKSPGLKTGREVAFGKHRESDGWGLLFVAGMEYASWVQATGAGRSVLAHAETIVSNELGRRLDQISVG